MARPIKEEGLKYFPFDTELELKVEALEAKHGLVGFAILVKLWQAAYKCKDGELHMKQGGVSLWPTYCKRWKQPDDKVKEILRTLLKLKLFDPVVYRSSMIITSNGIKKRIAKILHERESDRLRKSGSRSSPEVFRPDNSGKPEDNQGKRGEIEIETETETETETQKEGTVSRAHAVDSKDLLAMNFNLRLYDEEFPMFEREIYELITKENSFRTQKFNWEATNGNLSGDLKNLIYKIPDDKKRSLLYDVYNILKEKMNWAAYVKLCIHLTLRSSLKTAVRNPFKLTLHFVMNPNIVITEKTDGLLKKSISQITEGKHDR